MTTPRDLYAPACLPQTDGRMGALAMDGGPGLVVAALAAGTPPGRPALDPPNVGGAPWTGVNVHRSWPGATRGRRRARARAWLLGCLLLTVILQGCGAGDPLQQFNSWAEIEFDGHRVGEDRDNSGQAISCERESKRRSPLARLVNAGRWPEDRAEWMVLPGAEVDMRFELPGPDREPSLELTIGDAVYRSDAGTKVELQAHPGDRGAYRDSSGTKVTIEGLVGGRAVFVDVPLKRGDPFEGKQRLDRLVVEWDCLGRPQLGNSYD